MLTGRVYPAATGSITHIVLVRPPAGVNETIPSFPTRRSSDLLTPQADLAVTKDDGKTSVVPGTAETYTITVTNNGTSTVSSVNLTDTIPATLLGATFGTPSTGSYNSTTEVWSGLNLTSGSSVA